MDVVLFGAGASAFYCTCATTRPPLGPHLFDGLVATFPQALDILNEPAREAFESGHSFEVAMDAAWPAGSPVLAPFLRYLARYLSAFEPCGCGSNGYRRMISGLRRRLPRTLFASLNYDLILERTAQEFGLQGVYGDAPDSRTLGLLKLHGSSNVLPNFGRNQISGIRVVNCGYGLVDGLPVTTTLSTDEIRRWCENPAHDMLAPVMSVYAAGKRTPYSRFWVGEQRSWWAERLGAAQRVVIIGVRYTEMDTHIWGPLSSSPAALTYINPAEEDQELIRRWRGASTAPTEYVQSGFTEAIPLVLRRLTGGR